MKIAFGAMAKQLYEQLSASEPRMRHLQKDADAITRLAVRQVLTETETKRARKRLIKEIEKELGGE